MGYDFDEEKKKPKIHVSSVVDPFNFYLNPFREITAPDPDSEKNSELFQKKFQSKILFKKNYYSC